jgi:pimeloyl-ACP methyl ester carboxylesterase
MRYVLVPGAGGSAWFWHRVVPMLEVHGHRAIAVELPGDDPKAGLAAYTEKTLAAIDGDPDTIVVAHSLGGFTAAMVAARTPLSALIFVNAMIPAPGEIVGDWGDTVGSAEARTAAAKRHGYATEFDLDTYFMHDVPAEAIVGAWRPEADTIWSERCDFTSWPEVPIRALAGNEDRLFPVDFQRRVARERLGVELEVIPGGHLAALSRPAELVEALLRR